MPIKLLIHRGVLEVTRWSLRVLQLLEISENVFPWIPVNVSMLCMLTFVLRAFSFSESLTLDETQDALLSCSPGYYTSNVDLFPGGTGTAATGAH